MNIKFEKINKDKIRKSYSKDLESFQKVINSPINNIYNVIADKSKCGVIIYSVLDKDLNVKLLYLDESKRGKGIAKAILEKLLTKYNSVKAKPLNENSIKFFTSLGLTKTVGNTYSINN